MTDTGVVAVAEKLQSLQRLTISNCQMTDEGAVALTEKIQTLRDLTFRSCKNITDVGAIAISDKCTPLHSLTISDCPKITDVGLIKIAAKLTALLYLNISNCPQLTDICVDKIFNNLFNLRYLYLNQCRLITVLPESIIKLSNLQILMVEATQLSSLPVALRDLSNLHVLNVMDIPGLKLPPELSRETDNPRAILDYYFRREAEGWRTLNEAKLILVGNESVGKTSLVNFLVHDKPCSDTPKTLGVMIVDGVDVTSWDIDTAATGDNCLRLNVWDFGGQQVLCDTHHFFLTDRSLYLVVLTARRENESEQEANLCEWLRTIRTRTTEEVPVIVVINKSEPPQDLQLDEKRLMRDFPIIKLFVRTSCRDRQHFDGGGRGIAELRRSIVSVIRATLPHVSAEVPIRYLHIKEQLAKMSRRSSILNTRLFRRKCRAENVIDTREQVNLLNLLHHIGVIVKYDDTTLLDPNWLTTAVYRVLMHADVIIAGGEFSEAELGKLLAGLSPRDYRPDRWRFIATMMERFGLSFLLPHTKDRYLVPNRFPVEEPTLSGWDVPGLMRFRYEYQDPPSRGLLPRFVVLAHRHLTQPRIAWLNGVVINVQGNEVLVKIEPHKRRLSITVRGSEGSCRGALAVVREHFATVHDLNKLIPGKDVSAKIPVEIAGMPDAAFDYALLESFELAKITTIPYPNTTILFSVKQLLDGVGPEPIGRNRSSTDASVKGSKEGDTYYIFGPVGAIYKDSDNYQPHMENDMSNINLTNTGNMSGNAIGDAAHVTAEKIILNIREQLPPSASPLEEMRAVLAAAMEQLAKEQLDPDNRTEAEQTVKKIEKEMAKSEPNGKLVKGWLATIDAVSETVAKVVRAASPIAAMFT